MFVRIREIVNSILAAKMQSTAHRMINSQRKGHDEKTR